MGRIVGKSVYYLSTLLVRSAIIYLIALDLSFILLKKWYSVDGSNTQLIEKLQIQLSPDSDSDNGLPNQSHISPSELVLKTRYNQNSPSFSFPNLHQLGSNLLIYRDPHPCLDLTSKIFEPNSSSNFNGIGLRWWWLVPNKIFLEMSSLYIDIKGCICT